MSAVITARVAAKFLRADRDRIAFGGEVGTVRLVSAPRPTTPEWGSHAGLVLVDVQFDGDAHISPFWTHPHTMWELAD